MVEFSSTVFRFSICKKNNKKQQQICPFLYAEEHRVNDTFPAAHVEFSVWMNMNSVLYWASLLSAVASCFWLIKIVKLKKSLGRGKWKRLDFPNPYVSVRPLMMQGIFIWESMVTISFLRELVQVQTITRTSLKHIKQSKHLRMQGFQQIIMFIKTGSSHTKETAEILFQWK